MVAGFERFMVEFLRRNADVALGLTQAQLMSVGMMLIGGDLDRVSRAAASSASRRRRGSGGLSVSSSA